MDELITLWERPIADKKYMIAGWRQWADAGAVSSGLPQYLIERTQARKIGELLDGGFYLFQMPGTHHLLRPEIKFAEGYRQSITQRKNEILYAGEDESGLFLFLGEEPQVNVERYAEAFLDAVEELGVSRVVALGGVYGPMPYDKDREISCVYSLPYLKDELAAYAVKFSDYEGGSTIGTYLVDRAEPRGIEFIDLYAYVPAYDFSQLSARLQGLRIENDYKAWYDLMQRLKHMFGLALDLSDLNERSRQLVAFMNTKIDELERRAPQAGVRAYVEGLAHAFTELPFVPLDDVWDRELGDIFKDMDDSEPD